MRTGRYWHGERKREQERRLDWGKGGAVSRLETKREVSSGMLPNLGRGSERSLDVPGRGSDVTTREGQVAVSCEDTSMSSCRFTES